MDLSFFYRGMRPFLCAIRSLLAAGMCLVVVTTGFAEPLPRVITLGPSIAQTIAALDAADAVVARSQFLQEPPELLAKPSVGGLTDPNLELILSHKPDLILALEFLPARTAQILESAGIQVETVSFSGFDDITASTLRIGHLLGPGPAARAEALVTEWQEALRQVSTRAESRPRRAVLLTFGIEPIFCPGDDSYLDRLITAAGGENIARGAGSAWPRLNREAVLQRDPAVIVIVTSAEERAGVRQQVGAWAGDPFWSALSATKTGRVYWADSRVFSIPGPHILHVLHALAGATHAEEFPEFLAQAEKSGWLEPLADLKK